MLACEHPSLVRSSYRSGLACRLSQRHLSTVTRGVGKAEPRRSLITAPRASVCTTFEAAASGEWEGVTANFDARGRCLELPYHQVPAAFRWMTLASHFTHNKRQQKVTLKQLAQSAQL